MARDTTTNFAIHSAETVNRVDEATRTGWADRLKGSAVHRRFVLRYGLDRFLVPDWTYKSKRKVRSSSMRGCVGFMIGGGGGATAVGRGGGFSVWRWSFRGCAGRFRRGPWRRSLIGACEHNKHLPSRRLSKGHFLFGDSARSFAVSRLASSGGGFIERAFCHIPKESSRRPCFS